MAFPEATWCPTERSIHSLREGWFPAFQSNEYLRNLQEQAVSHLVSLVQAMRFTRLSLVFVRRDRHRPRPHRDADSRTVWCLLRRRGGLKVVAAFAF